MAEYSTGNDGVITSSTYVGDLKKPNSSADALAEIQTENFYSTLSSYYSYREADDTFKTMSHVDLLDYFYEDRSWRNNNTVSMGMDMANVMGEDNEERIQQFAYIAQTYKSLPSFWNDPNRSFGSWLIDNGGAMIADPVNLIGVGVGGQAAKQAYSIALRAAIKNKMSGELSAITIKAAAKEAEKAAIGQAMKKGALNEGTVNAVIAGGQDILLQNTAINAGIQDEFSLKQSGISTFAGFGFGTVFGAAFSGGAFKLTNSSLARKSIKNLTDMHNYGKSTTTGSKLFDDLTITSKSSKADINAPKNKQPPKTTKEYIKQLIKDRIYRDDKPPKLIINATKQRKGGYQSFVKNSIAEITEKTKVDLAEGKTTKAQMVEEAVALGQDRKKFEKMADDMANSEAFVKAHATVVAQGDKIRTTFDTIGTLSNELNNIDLSPAEQLDIVKQIRALRDSLETDIIRKQKGAANSGRMQVAHQINADGDRAAKLVVDPEDPKLKKKINGTFEEELEYWKAVGKLGDREQIIAAHQRARDTDTWDLISEYVNNNLLSSPDTHILNIISGLTQVFWKPATMLLRGANMLPHDKARATVVMREALQTFVYQFAFTGHALKRAGKSFYEGRAILDSTHMKHDSNIRQGQLQRWISEIGKLATEPMGDVGRVVQKAIVDPIAITTTLPMRVLSAGDEFLKSMMFKGRMAALVNSRVIEETPDFSILKGDGFRAKYKAKKAELEAEYIDNKTGRAVDIGSTVTDRLNSPLHYAREGSYTNPAHSVDPETGKSTGKITGWILQQTGKAKWTRALGLHFINTPSNLLRWNFQHLPFLGRYQFQMKHMLAEADTKPLAKDAGTFSKITNLISKSKTTRPFRDGVDKLSLGKSVQTRYLNPEAAAEANARIQMGYLLWGGALGLVVAGKLTGGGSRDWRINRERERNTGWQPYSWKTADGRYISLNRLDPLFTPMFMMADIFEAYSSYVEETDDLPPSVEKKFTEAAMAGVTLLTRNLTSKFYTKNIIELFNFMSSDDFMNERSPERAVGSVFSQFAYKAIPMSGGIKYVNRVTDEWERDIYDFIDRLKLADPRGIGDRIMPHRNMFGQTINRKTGWLFGLGGATGLWSTPFAMTKWQNSKTAKFLDTVKNWNYSPPSKTDRASGINLRNIRNKDNQTAYDRWLELKTTIKFNARGGIIKRPDKYTGKMYDLQQTVERLVADLDGKFYAYPEGETNGTNYQAQVITDLVRDAEGVAYFMMIEEFPEIKARIILQDEYVKNKFKESKKSYLDGLLN
jgi:hypothetical protein